MNVTVSLKGLDGVLATLKSLPPELVSRRGGPVLAALRTGARVIDRQRRANLQTVTANATQEGRASTGFLMKNLTMSRGKQPFGGHGERVLLRVKVRRYPAPAGAKASSMPTTVQVANLLEYGSSKQPAEPWIRPAFEGRAREAIETINDDLLKRIDRIVVKLARQNAAR